MPFAQLVFNDQNKKKWQNLKLKEHTYCWINNSKIFSNTAQKFHMIWHPILFIIDIQQFLLNHKDVLSWILEGNN